MPGYNQNFNDEKQHLLLAWLIVFFAIPLVNQLNVSLQTGDPETGYVFNWAFSTYADAVSEYDTVLSDPRRDAYVAAYLGRGGARTALGRLTAEPRR